MRTLKTLIILLTLGIVQLAQGQTSDNQKRDSYYNVKTFGAKGNGTDIDSRAINSAISEAAKQGGGTVYIPSGNYLSGSIHLKSNITLYLESGATLIAVSDDPEVNYDQAEPSINDTYQDYGHSHWHNALIWGDSIHDVSILGPGLIYGRGLVKNWVKEGKIGDKAISLHWCRNIIIRDISILHGGWFAILATGVDNFTVDNLKIDTNRDGIDFDCCKNVRVSNCFVNSPYDDGICPKSSFALGYARATENVTITNCQVSGYDEGTLLDGTYKRTENAKYKTRPTGRIKFGTESNGGFKNITISNCVFDYCRGIALETVDGALLEDVTISNITMRDIGNDPIFLRLGARMRGPKDVPIGELRRIKISNIVVYNASPNYSCTISGLPGHDIDDVQLSNIRIYYRGGGVKGMEVKEIPENAEKYPEPGMLGEATVYGLFIRHAKNIQLTDVQFSYLTPDYRPAFRFDDVKGIYMHHVNAQTEPGSDLMLMNNVSDLSIFQSLGMPDQQLKSVDKKTLK